MKRVHANEVVVTAPMVRSLIEEQFPQWRTLPIARVSGTGTVNAIFRIGPELVARFPLVVDDADAVRRHLEAEAAAARELIGRTRFTTPEPIALGERGAGYPGPWAVQTWVPGRVVTAVSRGGSAAVSRGGSAALGHDLAEFVRDVRAIPTRGRRFAGSGRGGDLHAHDDYVEMCFARSAGLLDVPPLRALWSKFRDLPRTAPDVMTHGDLIPGNLLVDDQGLTGVLDVGGLGPADPALDLVAAWHVLDHTERRAFRADLAGDDLIGDDLDWARGQAWAFEQAMGLVWYYRDRLPPMSELGRRTLNRLLVDP